MLDKVEEQEEEEEEEVESIRSYDGQEWEELGTKSKLKEKEEERGQKGEDNSKLSYPPYCRSLPVPVPFFPHFTLPGMDIEKAQHQSFLLYLYPRPSVLVSFSCHPFVLYSCCSRLTLTLQMPLHREGTIRQARIIRALISHWVINFYFQCSSVCKGRSTRRRGCRGK